MRPEYALPSDFATWEAKAKTMSVAAVPTAHLGVVIWVSFNSKITFAVAKPRWVFNITIRIKSIDC